jgi:hypothetical protein
VVRRVMISDFRVDVKVMSNEGKCRITKESAMVDTAILMWW